MGERIITILLGTSDRFLEPGVDHAGRLRARDHGGARLSRQHHGRAHAAHEGHAADREHAHPGGQAQGDRREPRRDQRAGSARSSSGTPRASRRACSRSGGRRRRSTAPREELGEPRHDDDLVRRGEQGYARARAADARRHRHARRDHETACRRTTTRSAPS